MLKNERPHLPAPFCWTLVCTPSLPCSCRRFNPRPQLLWLFPLPLFPLRFLHIPFPHFSHPPRITTPLTNPSQQPYVPSACSPGVLFPCLPPFAARDVSPASFAYFLSRSLRPPFDVLSWGCCRLSFSVVSLLAFHLGFCSASPTGLCLCSLGRLSLRLAVPPSPSPCCVLLSWSQQCMF